MGVRVIAGEHRGRILKTPAGRSTRPTGARAREAIFSILGPLGGERVLDLYAGSGAFGIEALSRGADLSVFVEAEPRASACIRQNLSELGLQERARVYPVRVERAAPALQAHLPFTLVFCDPPWADWVFAADAVAKLSGLLATGARLVFEHPAVDYPGEHNGLREAGLRELDQRRWGDTGMTLFERVDASHS